MGKSSPRCGYSRPAQTSAPAGAAAQHRVTNAAGRRAAGGNGPWPTGQISQGLGHGHSPALRCAADSLGADRLVLGTDFPYENRAVFERAVSYITTSGLAPGDPGRVHASNARELFALPDSELVAGSHAT